MRSRAGQRFGAALFACDAAKSAADIGSPPQILPITPP